MKPLEELNAALVALKPGQKVQCPNPKSQIIKVKENLTRGRADIPGADHHLEYAEALLLAEANGQLEFAPEFTRR
jgi:hypothetical protein